MKETILIKEIDGIKIISGFSHLTIEPMATKKKVEKEIISTNEYKDYDSKGKELFTKSDEKKLKKKKWIAAKSKNETQKMADLVNDITAIDAAIDTIINELKTLTVALINKTTELKNADPVYFEPAKNEKTPSDISALKTKFDALATDELLKETGTAIKNLKGITYFKKTNGLWELKAIEKINQNKPTGGYFNNEITATHRKEMVEQDQILRIKALDTTAKLHEKEKKSKRPINQCRKL